MNKFFNKENFIRYLNFLRPWNYLGHPELKLKNPRNKKELLIAMRDLRLWTIENADKNSSRVSKHAKELEHINRELHYLQMRALLLPFLFWIGVWFYMRHSKNNYWSFDTLLDRPLIQQQTGGSTTFHAGSVPKYVGADMADHTQGL